MIDADCPSGQTVFAVNALALSYRAVEIRQVCFGIELLQRAFIEFRISDCNQRAGIGFRVCQVQSPDGRCANEPLILSKRRGRQREAVVDEERLALQWLRRGHSCDRLRPVQPNLVEAGRVGSEIEISVKLDEMWRVAVRLLDRLGERSSAIDRDSDPFALFNTIGVHQELASAVHTLDEH